MKIVAFIISVLFAQHLFSQNSNDNILWDGKDLKWENFKGIPKDTSGFSSSAKSRPSPLIYFAYIFTILNP